MSDTTRDSQLLAHIEALANGTISEAEHLILTQRLKSDAAARALFRERMDLEAAVRTWAQDDVAVCAVEPNKDQVAASVNRRRSRRSIVGLVTVVAALLLMSMVWWTTRPADNPRELLNPLASNSVGPDSPQSTGSDSEHARTTVGRLLERPDCRWITSPTVQADRFSIGKLSLATGAAELQFDSGTNVVLEGPCDIQIESPDTARLLTGNVFVDVTEVSNGFTLLTPEARILDEGTQYAVALDADATEVHVFDGSVIWIAERDNAAFEDRIGSGEAKRFTRAAPSQPHRIPFGQRQFVRRIESAIRDSAGTGLLAYDGFENLAGQLRRGRSGFGWSGGWQSGRRPSGPLGEVIDAPDDQVFGTLRSGRRLLQLAKGEHLSRHLSQAVPVQPDAALFVSALIERRNTNASTERSIRISLEPQSGGRRHSPQGLAFGVTSEGFPFISCGSSNQTTASRIEDHETYLCLFKSTMSNQGIMSYLRIYRPGESPDAFETQVWTVHLTAQAIPRCEVVRISVGKNATWHLDELKIGTSWTAVTTSRPLP
jgi:ferric-dicitrate binding protein FerR (iron transport regulator)